MNISSVAPDPQKTPFPFRKGAHEPPSPRPWQQLMLISEVMTLPARQNTPEK